MNDQEKTLKIHFFYCVVMLSIAIIVIATDRWTAQKDFTTYLSNAATMTSLMLGLVAIFYSFIANDGLSKSLGNISTVADEVGKSRDQISQFVTHTTTATEAAERNAEAVERVTREVATSISGLHVTLESIRNQSQSLQATLGAIPTRLDQLEMNVVDAAKAASKEKVGKDELNRKLTGAHELSDAVVDRFLARSPFIYNLLTYALVQANRSRKDVSIKDVGLIIDYDVATANWAFVTCMSAVGLVGIDFTSEYPICRVSEVHKRLIDNTRSYIESYVGRAKSMSDNDKEKARSQIQRIDELFV
ncbi:hypothetical protein [Burkholderia sp. BCC1999]|uniref:hypothetical protein n=1 Tax=Burkholderia sp. BCC1999 TaxID=2817448 RepID=UPI002AC33505|nr:hypothetical protein [Burkholderia sp. BCC1999]